MKKTIFLMVMALVVLLAVPMVSYAETGQECAANCVNKCQSLGSGKEYAKCMETCLKGCYDKPSGVPPVPPPKPASLSEFKAIVSSSSESCQENITGTFLLALGGKLCCIEGGKVVGRCHELLPYYNPFDGECYASRDDCKKSGGGYDVCIKCTTQCK